MSRYRRPNRTERFCLPPEAYRAILLRYCRNPIPYAESRQEAERLKGCFQQWSRKNGSTQAADLLDRDWERMGTFYNYPKKQWQHLRTTNPVESPFSGLRLRTDAARRFKKVSNAQAVIWKMLLVAEKRFPPSQRSAPHEGRLSGCTVRRWSRYSTGYRGESRLSFFTHLLTVPPHQKLVRLAVLEHEGRDQGYPKRKFQFKTL